MIRFLLRRALYGIFLLAGVSTLAFCSLELAPGDYFDTLRTNPRVSRETVEALRDKSGAGRPLLERYGRWLVSVAGGDWGYSLAYDQPARKVIGPRAFNTLMLTGFSTVAAWLVAIIFGLLSAAMQDRPVDWLLQFCIALCLAIPDMVLALLLLLAAVRSGRFPTGGLGNPGVRSFTAHLLIPSFCLTLSLAPVLTAHVRAAVSEVLRMPFVRAARAHGIPPMRLLLRHVLPVAANPLISLLGLSIGALLSSSLIIEVLFSWPGLGQLLLESILERDIYLVVDIVTLSSLFLLLGNFLADAVLLWCDPRIGRT